MDEFIQVLKRMWDDKPFDFDGRYYKVENGLKPLKVAGMKPPAIFLRD